MPTTRECFCCRELPQAVRKQPAECITVHTDFFKLCLDVAVLAVAYCEVREKGLEHSHELHDSTRNIVILPLQEVSLCGIPAVHPLDVGSTGSWQQTSAACVRCGENKKNLPLSTIHWLQVSSSGLRTSGLLSQEAVQYTPDPLVHGSPSVEHYVVRLERDQGAATLWLYSVQPQSCCSLCFL
ncbi:P2X purinoceptor 7-like [Ixodes scapularis]